MLPRASLSWITMTCLAIGGMALPVAARAQQEPVKPPAEPAGANAPNSLWSRTLPGGTTIEVVGLSFHPSGPKTWWKPDGTPLAEPPCDRSRTPVNDDPDEALRKRVIIVRVTGVPEGSDFHWGIRESNSTARGNARRGGKAVPDLEESVSGFSDDLPMCTISFEIADGPWETLETSKGTSSATSRADGPSIIFSEAIATKAGTMLSVAHNVDGAATRLVAVDGQGKEHVSRDRSGGGVGRFSLLVAEFNLRPEEIREYRFQARLYKKGEIPNVSLNPTGTP